MAAQEQELSGWWDTISDLPIWDQAISEVPWDELEDDTKLTLQHVYQHVLYVSEDASLPRLLASIAPLLRHIRKSTVTCQYIDALERRIAELILKVEEVP